MATYPHEVHRLDIAIGAGFGDFRDRYEQSVPSLDSERFAALVREGASWDTVLRATAEGAPHQFIRYWTSDVGSLMLLAGDSPRCSSYLMGNHTIAERMYRHDPGIILDQPSTCFSSFGDPAIAEVGFELDHKLAALLEYLDAPVPPALTKTKPSGSWR
jgi:hypothetical protein